MLTADWPVIWLSLTGVARWLVAVGILVGTSPFPAIAAEPCKCYDPIPAEATAEGTCSITQQDGDYCSLVFRLEQRAGELSNDPHFSLVIKKFALNPQQLREDVSLFDHLPTVVEKAEDPVQLTVRALLSVIAVSNWRVADDRFVDVRIDRLLQALSVGKRDPAIVGMVSLFLGKPALDPRRSTAPTITLARFEVFAQRGCVAFVERPFAVTVKASWRSQETNAPHCGPPSLK